MVVERSQESRIELSERRSRKLVSIVQGTLGRVKTRTTILATQGAAVTKKKVEYLEGQSEQRVGDRVQRVPNPLIGKTYVLESRGGKLLISRPGGAAVSDYERERLELEHANLGRPSAFASLLPEGAVRPGERLTPDPATLAEAFGKHDVQVEQASIVLEAVTDEGGEAVGKFRISMKLVESDERTVRETELGGTVLIQTETGWPVLVDLSGPVRLEGSPPNANELSGKGQVSLRVQTHYE